MWELDYIESWALKNWCFWTVVLEKTLENPLDCKEIQQSILKEISPEYSLEGLILKLNSNTLTTWFIWKDPDAGKDWRREKGMIEDEMVGWHHWFSGHEFEQTLGDNEVHWSLACCSPWGHKESDSTWATELNWWLLDEKRTQKYRNHIKYTIKFHYLAYL